jgi:hypothetical protein
MKELRSLKTGRIHRLSLAEIREFYHEHVLGGIPKAMDGVRWYHRLVDGHAAICNGLRISGTALLELFRDGELIDANAVSNLIVNAGKDWVVDRLQSLTGSPALTDYIAIGTGTTAAAAGDTTLQTEVGTRVQGTISQPTSTTDRVVSTFAAGNGTAAITETGRLTASSGGTLLGRVVFSAINKGALDSLQVTYDMTVS